MYLGCGDIPAIAKEQAELFAPFVNRPEVDGLYSVFDLGEPSDGQLAVSLNTSLASLRDSIISRQVFCDREMFNRVSGHFQLKLIYVQQWPAWDKS